jgi:hypothetical protein
MDKWKAGEALHQQVQSLIGNHHPHLADIADQIVVIFKDKCSKKGDTVILGKTSKAPNILSVLGEKDYKFVIEIGADVWDTLSENQKVYLLDHQLCFIGGEEDEKTAEMKYFISEPDVYYFSQEVLRHGSWRTDLFQENEEENDI